MNVEQKRKRDADRRRKWYNSIGAEKKEAVKAKMRKYFHDNKEKLIEKQRNRRREARLRKAADQPDTPQGN